MRKRIPLFHKQPKTSHLDKEGDIVDDKLPSSWKLGKALKLVAKNYAHFLGSVVEFKLDLTINYIAFINQ